MKNFAKLLPFAAAAMPFLALAQEGTIQGAVDTADGIVQTLVPIFMTIVLLYFFWGLAKYIGSAGDPDKAKEGKSIMIYGAIAIFVMASIWGIAEFFGDSLGLGEGAPPVIEDFQF